MSSISSPGIGSGLDVNSIVTQLMAVEKKPLTLLQTKASGIQTKISSYGQVKAATAALYEAAKKLADTDSWRGKLLNSGDEGVLKGTATSQATATQFSVQVNALAKNQTIASGSVASGSAIGSAGTLTLQTGSWSADGSSFNGTGTSVGIAIDANDTLATIAGKINTQNAGVTAVVVKGTSGDQLLLRGSKTGAENGFALSASNSGLNALAYDAASVAAGNGATRTQSAQNASFTVNGIASNSASNTVTDTIAGVTLNLTKTSATPVDVTVSDDTKSAKSNIEAFQQAYNKLNSLIADLTRYDQATKQGQPLQGDSTAVSLQRTLRNLVGSPNGAGTYFSDLGLQLQRDGSLSINATKLDAALNDLPKLQQTLTNSNDGLVTRIRDFTFKANGVEGNITGRTKALQSALQDNGEVQDKLSTRLDQRQKNLLKQYQALDTKMSTLSSLSSYMTSQISQWNKSA